MRCSLTIRWCVLKLSSASWCESNRGNCQEAVYSAPYWTALGPWAPGPRVRYSVHYGVPRSRRAVLPGDRMCCLCWRSGQGSDVTPGERSANVARSIAFILRKRAALRSGRLCFWATVAMQALAAVTKAADRECTACALRSPRSHRGGWRRSGSQHPLPTLSPWALYLSP